MLPPKNKINEVLLSLRRRDTCKSGDLINSSPGNGNSVEMRRNERVSHDFLFTGNGKLGAAKSAAAV